jgi:hypothetical protein
MSRIKSENFFLQRAAGWCKVVEKLAFLICEQPAEIE